MLRDFSTVLDAYLRSYYQQRKLLQLNPPEAILESNQKLLGKLSKELDKDHNLDIDVFLKTSEDQSILHRRLIEEASVEKACERCNICKAYTVNSGCKKKVMDKEDSFPPICKEFEDSGLGTRIDRIMYVIDRCSNCRHEATVSHSPYGESECKKKLDTDEIDCKEFDKKDSFYE